MKKSTKIWLVTAGALTAFGLIVFAVAMSLNNWDFSEISTNKYETNAFDIGEKFNNISINTETADIILAPSEDGGCKVVCYEAENAKHSAAVENNTLTIRMKNERKWYEYIGINFVKSKITIYLPETEYASLYISESTGDIEIPKAISLTNADISTNTGNVRLFAFVSELAKIHTVTGNIRVENISAGALELSTSTGDMTLSGVESDGSIEMSVSTGWTDMKDIKCRNIITNGSTGDLSMQKVTATEKITVGRSTGNVKLGWCDAAEIRIETATGSVGGSLLTDKIFYVRSDTGHVEVPKTTTGGKCEIETDTGDVKIEISPIEK